MDKRKIVIGLLLTLSVISVIAGAAIMDTRGRIIRLENRIDHLDEEVDETATNVKKLLARTSLTSIEKTAPSKAHAEATSREYDFGTITKQNGSVYTNFTVKNTGTDTLTIGDIVTSCGCTTAATDITAIAPGKTATIQVTFDPNFHEEPQGRFSRSIFVPTNDPTNQEIELTIFVEIIN